MNKLFLIICVVICFGLKAQDDQDQITATLNDYIKGTSYNNPEWVSRAFYENADLFLSHPEKELWIVSIKEYVESFVSTKEKNQFNGRTGKILTIDIENDIAMAKAEINIEKANLRFIDLFLLKKLKNEWKIISKAATRVDENP